MMKIQTCKRCGETGLIWVRSKKGKWYLGREHTWQGDMYGAIRTYYPGHKCKVEINEPREKDACYWADRGMWRGV